MGLGCPAVAVYGQVSPAVVDIVDNHAVPQPFAPGVVTSRYDEWGTSFSPDNKTVYFSRGGVFWTVCYSVLKGGVWQRPKVASFSGVWNDTDPFVSPDGKKLFFVSNRPLAGAVQNKPNPNFHLWYVEQLPGGGWGGSHHVEGGANIDSVNDYGPSVSAKGTLYWCSRDRQRNAGMQGYYSTWMGSHYDQPKLVRIPGAQSVQDPFISADEQYLVFLNGNDLCIAYRQGEGWGPAQKLGPEVNDGGGNSSPYVSHDGKTLYYSSGRVKGFYQRARVHALTYDELVKEDEQWYNGSDNILMIPIRLPGS